jgi:cytochrome c oxidase accessory protein FixG
MTSEPETAPPTQRPAERQKVRLQVFDRRSSLNKDGSRARIVPADVKGRFTRARHTVFVVLMGIWASLPWIPIGGHPAVFLDVPARRFYLFGATLNAQDFWLAFFLLSGVLFALLLLAATLGRAWCAWACPQTVFLEGLFRPIERLIEGPRNTHLARDAGPMSIDKLWRKTVKHTLFLGMALLVAHVFLAYFVSVPSLFTMITDGPAAHPAAFVWTSAVGLVFYGNFAFFREQLCLVICPYGRLQSTLADDDSWLVGYDETRGEPRGKGARRDGLGACVDCNRCVVVCPTGIDIRNGQQLDCIGCTQCIDACDEVMDKVHQPRGLIRYDSLRGLRGETRRWLRPRLVFYGLLGLVGVAVTFAAVRSREPMHAQLLRLPGSPYIVEREGDTEFARNQFELHLVNPSDERIDVAIEYATVPIDAVVMGAAEVGLDGGEDRHVVVVVRAPTAPGPNDGLLTVRLSIAGDEPRTLEAPLLGPTR